MRNPVGQLKFLASRDDTICVYLEFTPGRPFYLWTKDRFTGSGTFRPYRVPSLDPEEWSEST